MTVSTLAIPLRAANEPRAGMEIQNTVWTNDDLERLHVPGLICIVGRMNEETSKSASLPSCGSAAPRLALLGAVIAALVV